ncbi:hypothetical protein NEOLEDRAFT_267071 [Neolentinus lepideus HHB14362 ss-1]|uniref:Uncharacterized protein n=1 Tax=Neolentinus lepideus HHB14362 ss-1 TaxID=1314782 RepID=A0A165T343_9AGAM|nr:hypothetical protein NEOLEDRAFT_267071 [Neolentinus lepideus HHB14362 ss-1]
MHSGSKLRVRFFLPAAITTATRISSASPDSRTSFVRDPIAQAMKMNADRCVVIRIVRLKSAGSFGQASESICTHMPGITSRHAHCSDDADTTTGLAECSDPYGLGSSMNLGQVALSKEMPTLFQCIHDHTCPSCIWVPTPPTTRCSGLTQL